MEKGEKPVDARATLGEVRRRVSEAALLSSRSRLSADRALDRILERLDDGTLSEAEALGLARTLAQAAADEAGRAPPPTGGSGRLHVA